MHVIGLCRLGRDIEVRYTQDGKPVGNLALAFNYGRKGQDGNRPTQWIDASLWGDRVEKLAPYLTKGTQISVVLSEPHIETFDRRDGGQGSKLVARVIELQLAGGTREEGHQRPAPQPRQEPAPRPTQQPASTNVADMESDIPF